MNLYISSDRNAIDFQKILDLYQSVGWVVYTSNPENLKTAILNSHTVFFASIDDTLVGLARSISDDVSIHYLQDIIVHPDYQRLGIGRKLFAAVLERYKHVRTQMLLTDDEEKQIKFYTSLGYENVKDFSNFKLNSFIKFN